MQNMKDGQVAMCHFADERKLSSVFCYMHTDIDMHINRSFIFSNKSFWLGIGSQQ